MHTFKALTKPGKIMDSFNSHGRKIREQFNTRMEPWIMQWRVFSHKNPRKAKWISRLGRTAFSVIFLWWFFFFAISLTVPTVNELKLIRNQVASDIYSADNFLLGRYFKQYRTEVQYDDLPEYTYHALVATEDARFYEHTGVDYIAWGRVLYRTILKGDKSGGGGSTISQQLAKNLLPRRDYLFLSLPVNKFREVAIARRLERGYDKKGILELYLNTVPFPENIYGIDVAARRFFNKPASALRIEESALLIGTLKATTYYNPAKFPERALSRRNVVLGLMKNGGYLAAQTLDSLQNLPLKLNYNPNMRNEGIAPYFREFVRQEVERMLESKLKPDGSKYNLDTDGLKVYTTLHTEIQRIAEEAVFEHMSAMQKTFDNHWKGMTPPWTDVQTIRLGVRNSLRYKQLSNQGLSEAEIEAIFEKKVKMTIFSWDGPKEVEMSPLDSVRYHLGMLQVGFLALEPNTGFIRAWVGGINHDFFQFDHVRARRQPGSVFKPIVYMTALQENIPPCEQIPNELIVYHEYAKGDWARKDWRRDDPEPHFRQDGTDLDDWIPQNADGLYGGSYSMEGALTNSVNTISVKLIMRLGVQKVIDMARELGITGTIPKEPSIALGSAEVSLFEMIQPFFVFASGGKHVPPVFITKIEDVDGNILVDFTKQEPRTVISTVRAATMTKMLQSVATYGTASRIRWMYGHHDIPLAGKTGTSQNHADGWFIGYTPKIIAGVWVGGDSPLVRFRNFENGQGAASALPVWGFFMQKLKKNPQFSDWQGGEFPALQDSLARSLACPLRIPSPEEMLADSLAQDSLLNLELLLPEQEDGDIN
jgi:penicillin-binding protein 1A